MFVLWKFYQGQIRAFPGKSSMLQLVLRRIWSPETGGGERSRGSKAAGGKRSRGGGKDVFNCKRTLGRKSYCTRSRIPLAWNRGGGEIKQKRRQRRRGEEIQTTRRRRRAYDFLHCGTIPFKGTATLDEARNCISTFVVQQNYIA